MKTIVSKIVKTEASTNFKIKGATLLSVDEAEVLPLRLRQYKTWWWLRSPGDDSTYAASFYSDGSVDNYGFSVDYDFGAVRPALQIKNLESSNFEIGDLFKFGNKEFEIISDSLAFCTTDIGKHRFDLYSNDYEKSLIKQYIDEWFEDSKGE